MTITMKKNNSIAIIIYLSTSFFLMLFLISMLFNVLGYWIHGGNDIPMIVKTNFFIYIKVGLVGFFVGFALWLFKIR